MTRQAEYLPDDFPEWVVIPPVTRGDAWGLIRETKDQKTYYTLPSLHEVTRTILTHTPAPVRPDPPKRARSHRGMVGGVRKRGGAE